MGKYTGYLNKQDKLSATVSYFTSKWDASGQVPLRAVESGLISGFGAIDDTEGGQTSRTNLLLNYEKQVSPWKNVELSFPVQDLLDSEWNETQFATESRLRNEAVPVEEIHFIPGTSFFLRERSPINSRKCHLKKKACRI